MNNFRAYFIIGERLSKNIIFKSVLTLFVRLWLAWDYFTIAISGFGHICCEGWGYGRKDN